MERSFAFYRVNATCYNNRFVHKGISIPQSVLVFADESAEWKVAGLQQLDRVALALNDFFRRSDVSEPVPVSVRGMDRGVPCDPRLTKIRFTSDLNCLGAADVLVISTRLVLGRAALVRAFESSLARKHFPALIIDGEELAAEIRDGSDASVVKRLRAVERDAVERVDDAGGRDWSYLGHRNDIARCTRQLFRSTGKSQDGFISRFIDRPLSRSLSRLLVSLPLLPNQWTLLLMAVPVAGAIFVIRGDYLGFAIGAILFYLHSVLDGCDGEIARVKYLESDSGSKLDGLCDRLTTLSFAVGLGFGLSRQPGNTDAMRWIYSAEGVSAAILIGITETLLTRSKIDDDVESGSDPYSSYVTGHRQSFNQGDQLKLWMIKHSGMLSFGEGATSFFGELTKRDVFNFVFMLLAICGLAQWVLHVLAICACAIVVLAVKEMLTPTLDVNPQRD
jgi:hypothetical protein